jgi:hypothetical protein
MLFFIIFRSEDCPTCPSKASGVGGGNNKNVLIFAEFRSKKNNKK